MASSFRDLNSSAGISSHPLALLTAVLHKANLTYVQINIYIWFIYVCVYIYICMHVCVHIYVCVYIYLYACMCIYMCVCMCVYIYIYACMYINHIYGFPSGSAVICLQCRKCRFSPWVRNIPWRRTWLPIPVFLSGEFHGQRSLVGYSLWGRKESDITEATEDSAYIWSI